MTMGSELTTGPGRMGSHLSQNCTFRGFEKPQRIFPFSVPLEELNDEACGVRIGGPRPREEIILRVLLRLRLHVVVGEAAGGDQRDVVEADHSRCGSWKKLRSAD